jgi:hypothetical protein
MKRIRCAIDTYRMKIFCVNLALIVRIDYEPRVNTNRPFDHWSPRLSECAMRAIPRSLTRTARQLPRISSQLARLPFATRITASIAIDQFVFKPELGKHWISKKMVYCANDNQRFYLGKTIMGMFSICWVLRHVLEIPLIIDISLQMFASPQLPDLFATTRLPAMIPLVFV